MAFIKKTKTDELSDTVDEIEKLDESFNIEELPEEYKQVDLLYVPQEAKDYYAGLGFDLQWIRVYETANGGYDLKNINRKEGDMYQFVPREEIPGLKKTMSSYFGEEVTRGQHGLYIVGDCALAKFPMARKAQKRRWIDEKTRSRSRAVIDDLKKNRLSPDAAHGEKFIIERDNPKTKGYDVEFGE